MGDRTERLGAMEIWSNGVTARRSKASSSEKTRTRVSTRNVVQPQEGSGDGVIGVIGVCGSARRGTHLCTLLFWCVLSARSVSQYLLHSTQYCVGVSDGGGGERFPVFRVPLSQLAPDSPAPLPPSSAPGWKRELFPVFNSYYRTSPSLRGYDGGESGSVSQWATTVRRHQHRSLPPVLVQTNPRLPQTPPPPPSSQSPPFPPSLPQFPSTSTPLTPSQVIFTIRPVRS
jgi:hypothetical protein